MERQSADLPPASRSRGRDDPRRRAKEGDPLPSVRNVAAEYRVNPLTVLKGYQQLVDEGLVEKRRGRGMFVNAGARDLLLQGERQKISRRRMAAGFTRRSSGSGLTPEELCWNGQPRKPTRDRKSSRGGALKPWHASKRAACARRSARRSRWTASICASKKAASSD